MAEFDDEEYDDEYDDEQDEQDEDDEEDDELTEDEENEADAAEEDIQGNKKNRKTEILKQFNIMKGKYMLKSTFWPFLSFNELKLCNQVKKIEPGQYFSFMNLVAQRKGAFTAKVNSVLSAVIPILPYILIALLVIIAIVAVVGTIMPWVVGDGNSTDGMSSPLGVKGDCFYGVRSIYRDAEQAKTDLLNDYVGALNYTITNFNSSNNGATLTITLPADDYNFADFETNVTYKNAYDLVFSLSQIVYAVDNENSSAPANLNNALAGIKYFGLDDEFIDDIASVWASYVINNSLYSAAQDVEINESTFSTKFESLLLNEYATEQTSRTEMLYVKDYIFEDEESYAENIPAKDYVAYIFMPKTTVDISRFSFLVSNQKEDFKMFLNVNGNLTEFSGEVFSEKGELDDEKSSYLYSSNVNAKADSFNNLDVNNIADGISLYNILHNLNAENYLAKGQGDFYTYLSGAVEVHFENNAPFFVAEYEVEYN